MISIFLLDFLFFSTHYFTVRLYNHGNLSIICLRFRMAAKCQCQTFWLAAKMSKIFLDFLFSPPFHCMILTYRPFKIHNGGQTLVFQTKKKHEEEQHNNVISNTSLQKISTSSRRYQPAANTKVENENTHKQSDDNS